MYSMPPPGRAFNPGSADTALQPSLEHVSYAGSIENANMCHLTLTQEYKNATLHPMDVAYKFSTSDASVFLGFEAQFGDTMVRGLVKEQGKARSEFIAAREAGDLVAYAETTGQAEDEVRIEIGNLASGEALTVRFRFMQMLRVSFNKFWELRLPCYGVEIAATAATEDGGKTTPPWDIAVNIIESAAQRVELIKSPSHEVEVQEADGGLCVAVVGAASSSPSVMKDFHLVLGYEDSAVPRCVVERIQDPSSSVVDGEVETESKNVKDGPSHCALVNFIPEFHMASVEQAYADYAKQYEVLLAAEREDDEKKSKALLREAESMESDRIDVDKARGCYIFVIDCSGSMQGARIECAKEALKLCLQSLPPNSMFQIIRFGSTHCAMDLATKRATNDRDGLSTFVNEDIPAALKWIDEEVEANFGGTEIYAPLEECAYKIATANAGRDGRAYSTFLLTDGEVYNERQVLKLIEEQKSACRTYTIGVGHGCSKRLIIEGARRGDGKHVFVGESDPSAMKSEILHMLDDAITPCVCDFNIETNKEQEGMIDFIHPNPARLMVRKGEVASFLVKLSDNYQSPADNTTAATEEAPLVLKVSYLAPTDSGVVVMRHKVNVAPSKSQPTIQRATMDDSTLHRMAMARVVQGLLKSPDQSHQNTQFSPQAELGRINTDNYRLLRETCLAVSEKWQLLNRVTAVICKVKKADAKTWDVAPHRYTDEVAVACCAVNQCHDVGVNHSNHGDARSCLDGYIDGYALAPMCSARSIQRTYENMGCSVADICPTEMCCDSLEFQSDERSYSRRCSCPSPISALRSLASKVSQKFSSGSKTSAIPSQNSTAPPSAASKTSSIKADSVPEPEVMNANAPSSDRITPATAATTLQQPNKSPTNAANAVAAVRITADLLNGYDGVTGLWNHWDSIPGSVLSLLPPTAAQKKRTKFLEGLGQQLSGGEVDPIISRTGAQWASTEVDGQTFLLTADAGRTPCALCGGAGAVATDRTEGEGGSEEPVESSWG